MIVVDTSVWVAFFRDAQSAVVPVLHQLIDDDAVLLPRSVRVELLSGSGRQTVSVLAKTLDALECLTPTKDTWNVIEDWVMKSAVQGRRFGIGDLLVAASAAERGALVWTLDGDFDAMVRLKWIRRFRPT